MAKLNDLHIRHDDSFLLLSNMKVSYIPQVKIIFKKSYEWTDYYCFKVKSMPVTVSARSKV
jgi:hypothetical protein